MNRIYEPIDFEFEELAGLEDPASLDLIELADGRLLAVSIGGIGGLSTDYYVVGHFLDASGEPIGGPFTLATATGSAPRFPSVAALPDGGFAMVYDPDSNLASDRLVLQYFDSAGEPRLITPYEVQQGTTIGFENRFRTLATGSNGENPNWARVAATEAGIVGTIWLESERIWTPERGWHDIFFVRGQTFDLDGVPQSPVSLGLPTGLFAAHHQIEAVGDGFVVTWLGEDRELLAQIFGSDFVPLHPAFVVSDPTVTGGLLFDVATLEDGNLVFAWAVDVGPGTARSYDTFVQVFQTDGTPVSEVVTVTDWVDGRQYQPTVTAMADGGFVVAWDGTPPPGGDPYTGLEARAFDALANALGEVFRIDNGDNYSSNALSLLGLSSGNLIASFQDQNPATGRWATQTFSPFEINASPIATGRQQSVEFSTTIDATAMGLASDEPITWQFDYSLDLEGQPIFTYGAIYEGASLTVTMAGETIVLPATFRLYNDITSGDVLEMTFSLPSGASRPPFLGQQLNYARLVLYDIDKTAFDGSDLVDAYTWAGAFDTLRLELNLSGGAFGNVYLLRDESGSPPPPQPSFETADLSVEPLPDIALAAGAEFHLPVPTTAFTDPDGDPLTLTATLANGDPLPSWLSFDGTTFSGTAPSTIGSSLEVRVRASDGELSAFDTFSLVFENAAPVAGDDTITLPVGGSGSIAVADLLANDFDPDGGAVYFFESSTSSWSTAGWDLFYAGTDFISYLANTNTVGPTSFDYRIIDDEGAVSFGTVTIEPEVQNTPPVAEDDIITLEPGASGTIPVFALLDNDFDPDGDSISLVSIGSSVDGWDFSYDPSTGLIAYAANTASGLGQTVEYVISDTSGSTATATVTVEALAQNAPPEFHPSLAYADDFNDGVLNTGEWSFPYNAVETGGYLYLEQYQTDLPVKALFTPGEPVKDASLRYSTLHHNSDISSYGEYYYGRSIFQFSTANGEQVQFFLTAQRTLWAPDYDNDAANYDRPKLIVTLPGGSSYNLFADTIFSSSLFDVWSDFSLALDSDTGTVVIDMDSDGVAEFTVSETSLVGAGLISIDLRPYGWFTGHHIKIDDFSLVGGAQTEIVTNEDTPSDPIQLQASDPDGDPLTFRLKPGEEPTLGSVSIIGDTFTYTPAANVNGADSFIMLVEDGNGGVDEQQFSVLIAPTNDAPFVDLDPQAAGADIDLDYIADSGAQIISPDGIVSDIDSADITGLWNINIIDGNGLISFVSEGDGPGQVRFEGTEAYYEGVLVGTTFGTSGTGLRVFFNTNGTPEAAEAILRSVAYSVTTDDFSQTARVQFLLTDGDPHPDGGQSRTITFANITNTLPNVAPIAEDISGNADEDGPAITLAADFTDADPADTHTYTIDTTGTLGTVVNNGDGTFDYDPAGAFDYLRAGAIVTDSFTYTVDDGKGGVDTATATISITGENDLPVVYADPAAGQSDLFIINDTADATASVTLIPRFSFTDADIGDSHAGNTIHVGTPGGRRGTFGGGTEVGQTATTPGLAYIVYILSGAEMDKLAEGEVIDEVVRLRVLDNSTGSFTPLTAGTIDVTFRLVGVNDIPIAFDDSGETSEDEAIQIDVLANDVDPDNGAVLTLSAVGNLSGKGTASISGNQLVFDPEQDFDYLADGESEIVTLTYDVVDEHGATDSAQVQVTVTGANDAPVFVGGGGGGDLDLIFATDETLDLFFLNDGSGNFVSIPNSNNIGTDNWRIAAADFDGDGDNDIVIGGHQGGGSPIWLNDGNGNFTPGQYIGQLLVGSLETEDFDGDGDIDIMMVGVSDGGTNLFINDGNGNFSVRNLGFDYSYGSVSVDLDKDGDLDVVTAGYYRQSKIYFNDGNGNFSVDTSTLPNDIYSGVEAGDFDGDGNIDLAFADLFDRRLDVFISDGLGGFTISSISLAGYPTGIEIADLNGDGILDLYIPSSTIDQVLFGDGNGSFVDSGVVFPNAITRGGVLGDVDGDGDIDIVAARQTVPSAVYLNDGSGNFTDSGQSLGLAASFAAILVDLDGDGPATDSASLTELTDGDPDELAGMLETNGALTFSDPEAGDQHTATFTPLGSGYLGNFAIDPIAAESRVLDWTFSVADADLNSLGEGEFLEQVYLIDLSDGGAETAQSQVTITLYGRNDAPEANDIAVDADEDGPGVMISADYTDVDLSDVHGFTIDTSGTSGQVIDNGDGTFTYDAAGAFEYLALGETATDSFSYTVDDGNGGVDTATVTVTVHGQNDLPVVWAGPGQSTEFTITDTSAPEAPSTLKMYFNFSDADLTDLHAGSGRFLGTTGAASIGSFGGTIDKQQAGTANGVGMLIYYVFDGSKIDALGEGETVQEFGQLVILDNSTGSYSPLTAGTIDVTMTIVGVNDTPIAQDDVAAVDEDASTGGNLIAGSDTDAEDDVLSILEVEGASPGTAISGVYGTLVVAADGTFTYSADADITDTLAPGTVVQDVFDYIVTDGSLTDTATLTVTVTAIDDGVLFEPSRGGGTLIGTDGDDIIAGGRGREEILGGEGFDQLSGDRGDDTIDGGAGIDFLDGGDGNDIILGGAGDDLIIGGKGSDVMTGGEGADIFVIDGPDRSRDEDTITDFEVGVDSLYLADGRTIVGMEEENGNTILSLDNRGEIILQGVSGLSGWDDLLTPQLPDWFYTSTTASQAADQMLAPLAENFA
ncbi:Ig-like domain-containing protein [Aurantiacibacter hainanensis]|uniref:Ig-like domain-containing protein n=1 Tax=Aurantiacibacter hainanensis TaxID=3076114 RepID=UPI0030C67D95